MQVGGSSSSKARHAHPCDVHALQQGATEAPRRGIWKTALANVLKNHQRMRGVTRQDLPSLLQYMEEDMGGDVDDSTQEGDCRANGQGFEHTLSVHASGSSESLISSAEEELETLQYKHFWRRTSPRGTRLRGRTGKHSCIRRSNLEKQRILGKTLRARKFIRRHDHGDALRIAASALFASVGVVETQGGEEQ